MSLKAVMTRAQTAVCTAVSPMSGSLTFDIDKKNRNGANLRLRHALRAGGVKSVSADDLSRCVDEVKKIFDVNELSANQFDGLLHFLNGRDVFDSLPTGSGKSLIFQMAPLVEKWIARTDPPSYRRKDAVIVVFCPLITLKAGFHSGK